MFKWWGRGSSKLAIKSSRAKDARFRVQGRAGAQEGQLLIHVPSTVLLYPWSRAESEREEEQAFTSKISLLASLMALSFRGLQGLSPEVSN